MPLQLAHGRLLRFPAALEQLDRRTAGQLRSLAEEPLADAEFVVSAAEIAHDQSVNFNPATFGIRHSSKIWSRVRMDGASEGK
jgi:hypothetical protein